MAIAAARRLRDNSTQRPPEKSVLAAAPELRAKFSYPFNYIRLLFALLFPTAKGFSRPSSGDYYLAIRPHELSLQARSDADVELQAVVKISEISGSESHIHFRLGSDDWVAQLPGVHSHEIGSILKLHMNLERALYFDSEQRLISSDG